MTTRNLAIAILLALGTAACTNPSVPQGFEGYVYQEPLWMGKLSYKQTLRGPASTGLSWRLYTINIDMQSKAYKEDFQLLTRDNLTVSFEVTTNMKLRVGSVKQVVEEWGGDKWYEWNVLEPLRTIVREQVSRFSATDIQLETPKVKALIEEMLRKKYENTPIDIESVAIGEIQFPKNVADAIGKKISTIQELERQEFVLAKTHKEAAIKVLEALRLAKQQRIISSTLDPLYVQQRAVEVYRKLAQSPNKTILVLPNSAEGTGMPLVLTGGKPKIFTAADEQLLKDMEDHYMHLAKKADVPVDESGPGPEGGAAPAPTDGPAAPAPATPATAPTGAKPAPVPGATR